MEEKTYFGITSTDKENEEGEIIEGDWRTGENSNLLPLKKTSSNMYGRIAAEMRDQLATYFNNEGAEPFQWNK